MPHKAGKSVFTKGFGHLTRVLDTLCFWDAIIILRCGIALVMVTTNLQCAKIRRRLCQRLDTSPQPKPLFDLVSPALTEAPFLFSVIGPNIQPFECFR